MSPERNVASSEGRSPAVNALKASLQAHGERVLIGEPGHDGMVVVEGAFDLESVVLDMQRHFGKPATV